MHSSTWAHITFLANKGESIWPRTSEVGGAQLPSQIIPHPMSLMAISSTGDPGIWVAPRTITVNPPSSHCEFIASDCYFVGALLEGPFFFVSTASGMFHSQIHHTHSLLSENVFLQPLSMERGVRKFQAFKHVSPQAVRQEEQKPCLSIDHSTTYTKRKAVSICFLNHICQMSHVPLRGTVQFLAVPPTTAIA